jgi:histidyl-tRNA synthetase
VVGESELEAGTAVLKDLQSGEQTTLPRADLVARLRP